MPQDDADWELIPISALNHYAYCPRRCALIHVEQTYSENVFTMRGHDLHERTDQEGASGWEEGVRVERALPLCSKRLGLISSNFTERFPILSNTNLDRTGDTKMMTCSFALKHCV